MSHSDDTTPSIPMTEMHPELRTFCQEMRTDMSEVKTALVGNKYQVGLIPRVDGIEKVQAEHSKKFLVWGSILSAAGTALVFIKDYLHSPKP